MIMAIASRAGCTAKTPNVDDDSVDFTISTREFSSRPALDLQLKCTGQDIPSDPQLRFALGLKNYDDLRLENLMIPRILVVLLVPGDINLWLEQNEDRILMRRCCYWVSLRGQPPTSNLTNITVSVPRTNLFTHDSLTAILQQIHNGETP